MNNWIKHLPIAMFFLFVLGVKLAFLLFSGSGLWWDSSVYIGMSKHIYSFGESGLWEPSRPVLWPIIIGLFWKFSSNYIFLGKVLSILISLGSSIVVYIISAKYFGKKTAFLAALLFSFSPLIFLSDILLLTETISAFFLLLGVYFFLSQKNFLSGLLLGLSFMSRFFQIFFALPIIIIYIFRIFKRNSTPLVKDEGTARFLRSLGRVSKNANIPDRRHSFQTTSQRLDGIFAFNKKSTENCKAPLVFLIAFAIPVAPYILSNVQVYNDAFYPFSLQIFMTKNTGWIFHQPLSFYFTGILKENFLAVFSIFGFWLALKERNAEKKYLLVIFISVFALYNLENHKEMRFLIPLLPFLYMFTSYGIASFSKIFRKSRMVFMVLVILLLASQAILQLNRGHEEKDVQKFQNYALYSKIKDGIWISNPMFLTASDKKAEELIYYPLYNSSRAVDLRSKINSAQLVMLYTCDILPCPPSDANCGKETEKLIDALQQKLGLIHYTDLGNCTRMVFEK